MSVRVYRLDADVEKFQWILPSAESAFESALEFDGEPRLHSWQPLDVYVFNPRKRRGDFMHIMSGALVVGRKAQIALDDVLKRAGELLPLRCEDGSSELRLLHVTECVNCLAHSATQWEETDGKRTAPRIYEFHKDRLSESSLFTLPETWRFELLCHEGLLDEERCFKACYDRHKLTGLRFELLWEE